MTDAPYQITEVGPSNFTLDGIDASTLAFVGRNYLLKPDFTVNQRGFAGGTLSDGIYGHDR